MDRNILKTNVTKRGLLVKRGLGWIYRPYAQRLFQLYANEVILTYESPENGDMKGMLHLENKSVISISHRIGYAFIVYVKKRIEANAPKWKRKDLLLIASSEEERYSWINCFNAAISQFYGRNSMMDMEFQLEDLNMNSPFIIVSNNKRSSEKPLAQLSMMEVLFLLRSLHMPASFAAIARAQNIDGKVLSTVESYDDVIHLGFVSSNDIFCKGFHRNITEFKVDGVPIHMISQNEHHDKQMDNTEHKASAIFEPPNSTNHHHHQNNDNSHNNRNQNNQNSPSYSKIELLPSTRRPSLTPSHSMPNAYAHPPSSPSNIKNRELISWAQANGFKNIQFDINCNNESGFSTVIWASKSGNDLILKLLLEGNADPNACNDFGKTAVHYSIEQNHVDVIALLLDYSKDDFDRTKQSPLAFAATHGKLKALLYLLERNSTSAENTKPIIDDRDGDGKTALILAVEHNHYDIVYSLVNRGADLDLKDDFGYCPVMIAASKGMIQMLTLFFANGRTDVNKVYEGDRTLLMVAVLARQKDVVFLLLGYNANVAIKDSSARTALNLANKHKFSEIIEILKDFH